MRINNLNAWEYNSSLSTLLFFAQKMDELLFHHSTDTYRYPVLSIIDLCDEYITVYKDVEDKIIAENNLKYIKEELIALLKEDTVAIKILSSDYKERFVKNNGSWSKKEIYENIIFMRRKLGGGIYLQEVIELLRNNIKENKEKRLVDRYSGVLARLLIDVGYSDTYIYNCLHEVFFSMLLKILVVLMIL